MSTHDEFGARVGESMARAGEREIAPEHTPGPWRRLGPTSGSVGIAGAIDPGWGALVTVHGIGTLEGEANANLVESAPALLDALLVMREIYTCLCCSMGACRPDVPCQKCRDDFVRADAAVNQATA